MVCGDPLCGAWFVSTRVEYRTPPAERDVGEVAALVRLSEWQTIQVRRTFSPSSCQQNCDSLQPNITGPAMQWAFKFFNRSVGGNALLVLR
jgi:hypothetical protein